MSLWRGTICTNCEKENECAEAELMFKGGAIAYGCSACVPKPQTNGERIRQMTDEELAEFLDNINSCSCSYAMGKAPCNGEDCPCWLAWLKAPVEADE